MPYRVTVCRSCDCMTTNPEHGPEGEVCYAPDGFEDIDVFVRREVEERADAARLDERERLSARVYENGWCPTCAAPARREAPDA